MSLANEVLLGEMLFISKMDDIDLNLDVESTLHKIDSASKKFNLLQAFYIPHSKFNLLLLFCFLTHLSSLYPNKFLVHV